MSIEDRVVLVGVPGVRVKSSTIDTVAFELNAAGLPVDKGRLLIRFRTVGDARGDVYQYDDVPGRVFDALVRAPSVGSYFHAHVKKAYVTWKLVRDPSDPARR